MFLNQCKMFKFDSKIINYETKYMLLKKFINEIHFLLRNHIIKNNTLIHGINHNIKIHVMYWHDLELKLNQIPKLIN
jgi:hypothetical protein